jgi:agmatine deiminase
MKWYFAGFLTLVLCSCSRDREFSESDYFRQAAEYEPTRAVWMQWPNYIHKSDAPIEPLILSMIREISPYAPVRLMIAKKELWEDIRKKCSEAGIDSNRISFHFLDYSEFWTRDMGPRFVKNKKEEKKIVDFGFNTWSYLDEKDSLALLDEQVDEKVAELLSLKMKSTSLIVEGGDNEINADGILMLTESVQKKRNPHLSKKEMEKVYREMIGAKSFIWFKKGLRDDDFSLDGPLEGLDGEPLFTCLTTHGHVDEYARFANDSTILFARGDVHAQHPVERESAFRMKENETILKAQKNRKGRPFNIIYVPLVPAITAEMDERDGTYQNLQNAVFAGGYPFGLKNRPEKMIAAASYLNFVIINGLVLVPQYEAKTDREAMLAFKKAFPDKKIVSLNPISLNWGGGGMHCITQNEP